MLLVRSSAFLSILFFLSLPLSQAHAAKLLTTWYGCPFSANCVASRHFPKGTVLRLHYPKTGRSVIGVVRDYGPEAWTRRQLDVSTQIARQLGMISDGVALLDVEVVRQH